MYLHLSILEEHRLHTCMYVSTFGIYWWKVVVKNDARNFKLILTLITCTWSMNPPMLQVPMTLIKA